jgi:hypothetical protein
VASDPQHPTDAGSYVASGRDFRDITLTGDRGYCYEQWGPLVTIDISTRTSPSYVGEVASGFSFSDIDISGSFIGLSRDMGFSLYDITDPDNPSLSGDYETPDDPEPIGNGIVAAGDYVYMACRRDGLRVMDVSDPSNPTLAGICAGVNASRGLAVSGKYAYCMASNWFYIVDVSSPNNPYAVTQLHLPCIGDPCDWYDQMDVAVEGSYAYVSGTKRISGDWYWPLAVIDISNPLNPGIIGTYAGPEKTSNFGGIAVRGNYVYAQVTDESLGPDDRRAGMRIMDVSNPEDPTEVGVYRALESGSFSADLIVRGDYAYLAGDRLRIIDIQNPLSPTEIAFSDNFGNVLAISGDYAYLENLEVVDISNPYNPYYAGYYLGDGYAGVAASGNTVYVLGSLFILKNLLAPEVSITNPADRSTLSGSVSSEVQALDGSGINKVEFYIDDVLHSTDYTPAYSSMWDTTTVDDGLHRIRARAYSNAGKASDAEIEVEVDNIIPVFYTLNVSAGAGGITIPSPGNYDFLGGTVVEIEANPDSGYKFSYWSGDAPSGHETDNPLSITMTSNKSVTAHFSYTDYTFNYYIYHATTLTGMVHQMLQSSGHRMADGI